MAEDLYRLKLIETEPNVAWEKHPLDCGCGCELESIVMERISGGARS